MLRPIICACCVLLAKLGRHKMVKACRYLKRLADRDVEALEALIAGAVGEVSQCRYVKTELAVFAGSAKEKKASVDPDSRLRHPRVRV
jgi:hypothetical protein